jgi:hypothetical protein
MREECGTGMCDECERYEYVSWSPTDDSILCEKCEENQREEGKEEAC